MEKRLKGIPEKIKEYGLLIMAIADEGHHNEPGFAYSIGIRESLGKLMPELIVVGLPGEISHMLINDAYARMKECGEAPCDGDILSGLGDGDGQKLEFVFKTVQPGNQMNLWTRNYYGEEVPTLQIVWPSEDKKYPWDDGYHGEPQEVTYAKKPFLSLVERGSV
jgi:Domain of unknown function (DUF4262)